jgi:predicted nucleotidyltransferase
MRLTNEQRRVIRESAAEVFGPRARVLLFGSRLDDEEKGGDIDLLVASAEPVDEPGLAAARMSAKIQARIGERKIDVLLSWPGSHCSPAHSAALARGVEL